MQRTLYLFGDTANYLNFRINFDLGDEALMVPRPFCFWDFIFVKIEKRSSWVGFDGNYCVWFATPIENPMGFSPSFEFCRAFFGLGARTMTIMFLGWSAPY